MRNLIAAMVVVVAFGFVLAGCKKEAAPTGPPEAPAREARPEEKPEGAAPKAPESPPKGSEAKPERSE